MSKINNLQPKVIDSSFLPTGKTAAKTADVNPNAKEANAAINHLTNRFAEMQKVQTSQISDDFKQPVAINFKTDFKGKKLPEITQQDALRVMYEKLADKAKLKEPYRTEFVEEMGASKLNIIHSEDAADKSYKKDDVLTAKEFTARKKGEYSITPSDDVVKRLGEYQSNQNLPDQLLAKYQKPFGELDEVGLGKELAQLSKNNFREVQEVINRLKNNNEGMTNQGQNLSVANQMLINMSDEDISLLAQKRDGNKFLKGINDEIKTGKPGSSDIPAIINSKRIDTAREKALSNILGDKNFSLSEWENPNLDLSKLKITDADTKKASETFYRLHPEKVGTKIVKGSEDEKEITYLAGIMSKDRYIQANREIMFRGITDTKQLNEKIISEIDSLNPPISGASVGGINSSEQMAEQDAKAITPELKEIFESVGKKYGVPPSLIAALASRESRMGTLFNNGNGKDNINWGWGDWSQRRNEAKAQYHGFGIIQIDKNTAPDTNLRNELSDSYGKTKLNPYEEKYIDLAVKIVIGKLKGVNANVKNSERIATAVSRNNGGSGLNFPNSDKGTHQGDYSNDVLARAKYYAKNWENIGK